MWKKKTTSNKKYYIFFIILCLSIISCNINSSLESATTVDDVKLIIDSRISDYNQIYADLCEKKRNDQLKLEYQNLHSLINEMYGCSHKCENLSYQEQKEISDYVITKFEEYPHLKNLSNTANVDCW